MTGCVINTAPSNDLGFTRVAELKSFEGCYANCSDTADGSTDACLSGIIWPEEFQLENKPARIQVLANNNELAVSGFKQSAIVKTSEFKNGEDFDLVDGKIELKDKFLGSGASEPGNVFIGLATGNTTLGVDPDGNARVKNSYFLAGTAFLIVPILGGGSAVTRIKRLSETCEPI